MLSKATRLEALLAEYPDLVRYQNRWKKEYFCSKKVNEQAIKYESCHSCGCCDDAPLLIKPYVELSDGMRIYSDPHEMIVGEKDGLDELLYAGWEEKLIRVGFRREIVDSVRSRFKNHEED